MDLTEKINTISKMLDDITKKDNFTNENEEDIKKIRVQEILSTINFEIKKQLNKIRGAFKKKNVTKSGKSPQFS